MVPLYLVIINAISFLLMLVDKHRARKNLWRIPEAVLIGCGVLGGSIGALIGMYSCRHKTKHVKFTVGMPVILALQIVLSILLLT